LSCWLVAAGIICKESGGEKSSFEDLECWKKGRNLKRFVSGRVLPNLPKDEKYRLGDQLIRAGRSVTANIAEGYGRYHPKDEAHYLNQARGSLHEILDHLIEANDETFIPDDLLGEARELIDEVLRLLNGYRAYVLRRG